MMRFPSLIVCGMVLLLGSTGQATDPMPVSAEAVSAAADQRSQARQLIQQRAIRLARERQARMEARKRAGISLQRPVRPMPWWE